jgi:hypothetical protein
MAEGGLPKYTHPTVRPRPLTIHLALSTEELASHEDRLLPFDLRGIIRTSRQLATPRIPTYNAAT